MAQKKKRKTIKTPVKTKIKKPVQVVQKTLQTVNTNVHKRVNIPNLLTMLRIWAIPAIVATFFFQHPAWAWVGLVLFALAGITDYMDGYLARHLNQLSRFGRVLDPIADKLLVSAVLLMLAYERRLGVSGYGIFPAVIIMCREILVSGLREFLAEIKVGMPVTRLAKYKTAVQLVALPLLMVSKDTPASWHFGLVGEVFLWTAAVLTLITGYDYLKQGLKYIYDKNN